MHPLVTRTLEIPENITVRVDGKVVEVRGEKGRLTRDFSHAQVSIQLEDNQIRVQAVWPRKKEVSLVGTIYSHIKNMIVGVTEGYTYKLKIVYSHFPISVKIDDKKVIIENFTGERDRRIAKIIGDTTVTIKDEDIIVQGINLEDVSQTAANVEQATKIKSKDPRVFLDGIYVYEKQRG